MFAGIKEVAVQLGYSEQTVRNRIADGSLRAIQSTPGGAYRIPIMEIEAFKRRHGLASRVETVIPVGVVHVDPDQFYRDSVEPSLRACGLSSPEGALRATRDDPSLLGQYSDVLAAYAAYVSAVSARALATAAG